MGLCEFGKGIVQQEIGWRGMPEINSETGRPSWCFVTKPSTGMVVIVDEFQRGYHASPDVEMDVEAANAMIGVDSSLARPMLIGSMFGWNVKGAEV